VCHDNWSCSQATEFSTCPRAVKQAFCGRKEGMLPSLVVSLSMLCNALRRGALTILVLRCQPGTQLPFCAPRHAL